MMVCVSGCFHLLETGHAGEFSVLYGQLSASQTQICCWINSQNIKNIIYVKIVGYRCSYNINLI